MVQTFAPHAPEKSLTDGVHVRRPDGSLDDPRSEGLGGAVEVGAELTVPVADDETRSFAERRCSANLLGSPLLAGSPRYRHVHDFARSPSRVGRATPTLMMKKAKIGRNQMS